MKVIQPCTAILDENPVSIGRDIRIGPSRVAKPPTSELGNRCSEDAKRALEERAIWYGHPGASGAGFVRFDLPPREQFEVWIAEPAEELHRRLEAELGRGVDHRPPPRKSTHQCINVKGLIQW